MEGNTKQIRRLRPTRWMCDVFMDSAGKPEANSRSPCDEPFFANNTIEFDSGTITTHIYQNDRNTLVLKLSSYCPYNRVTFDPVTLSFEGFIEKLEKLIKGETDFITFDVPVCTNWLKSCTQPVCRKHQVCSKFNNLMANSSNVYRKGTITIAVQFDLNEVREALQLYYGVKQEKGGNKMSNIFKQLFGNLEFGLSNDPRIASTMLGIVVEGDDGNLYSFNPATRQRQNMLGMKPGDFPILLQPSAVLQVGHLYREDGKYYWVESNNDNNNSWTGMNAFTGEIQTFMNKTNIAGYGPFHTEVVCFDPNTLMNPASQQNMGGNILSTMLIMSMLSDDDSEQTPYSLSKLDKNDVKENDFNGLGKYWPLLINLNGGNFGQLGTQDGKLSLPLLMAFFGNKKKNGDDLIQLMVITNMLGGNNNATNPFGNIMNGLTSAFPGMTAPAVAGAPAMTADSATTEYERVCTGCRKKFGAGVNFCTECGSPVVDLPKNGFCSKCGVALQDGAKFCHACGQPVTPPVPRCPGCGKEVASEDKFCPYCGTPLKYDDPAKPATNPAPAPAAATSRRNPAAKPKNPKGGTSGKNPAPAPTATGNG